MHYKLLKLVVMVTIITIQVLGKVNLFWAGPRNLSFQLGRMGPLTLRRLAVLARIQGMNLDN